ncbi:acyltransferase [Candidatus Saccharibacteria bacterium]|nr:acyltransferase [Candidatus Saccharibacteria bacterium]
MKERDPVFDIMKGFAMLSVIIAHTEAPWLLYHTFLPFRVPLFFAISGYFAKEWLLFGFLKNGAKRVLIPLAFTSLVMLAISLALDEIFGTSVLNIAAKSLVLGGASWPVPLGEVYILSAGPLWFLWATLLVRIYWSFLQRIRKETLRGAIILFFAIAAYNSKLYFTLPFSIQASFGALGFFYAGFLIKRYYLLDGENVKKILPICFVCLVYITGFSNMDVNLCIYEAYYVIEILGTIAAFFVLYTTIKNSRSESKFWSLFNFVGRYSIIVLCVHAIDQNMLVYWFPYKILSAFTGNFQIICAMMLRIIFAVSLTYLISKNKFLCEKIFFIK